MLIFSEKAYVMRELVHARLQRKSPLYLEHCIDPIAFMEFSIMHAPYNDDDLRVKIEVQSS